MKPNDLLLPPHLIISNQGVINLEDSGIIMDSHQPNRQFIKTSPSRDTLSELLNMPPRMSVLNEESNDLLSSGDANSLIVDLNDLLQRDPTLSTLSEDNLAIDTNFDFMNSMNTLGSIVHCGGVGNNVGMEIPKSTSISNLLVPNNSPATWVPNMGHNVSQVPANATVIKSEPLINGGNGSNIPEVVSGLTFSNAVNMTSFHGQPTLSQLNSSQHDSGIKMETVDLDLDDIGHFFMKNNSPNVTLGVGPNTKSMIRTISTGTSGGLVQVQQQVTGNGSGSAGQHTSGIITPNSFWTGADDSNSFSGTTNPWSTLSSSVPVNCAPGPAAIAAAGGQVSGNTSYNISPLSDILTDLSSNSGSTPNQSLSPNLPSPQVPSQAGPTRSSTLHKLLMRKDQQRQTGRPSPVRSPDGAILSRPSKTLEVLRNSLSSSSTMLTHQQLSTSAPVNHSYMSEAAAAASGSGHPRIWSRREPRPHISSVCSVGETGETSTLADEVNEVLGRMDPNDLQDIVSDDEDADADGSQANFDETITSDDDSDLEGTSPSTSKLNTSGASSGGGSKKEQRHFWMYNVQAKGPKGQKITFETRIEDPHVLSDIVDPVFSGEVQLQGIKHSGKARRGDGNDLTSNPKKLAAIGKELDQLSKIINDLTPVSEMPFGARCKSRKEKNKLASRACRLKKKAQHEANKLKCEGLSAEHNDLVSGIAKTKALLLEKANPNSRRSQQEITDELDIIVRKATSHNVAGGTSDFVNRMIEKHMPYV
jgi:hypothetical protein